MLIERPEKVYISSANVDMRKSIDGLSAIVKSETASSTVTAEVSIQVLPSEMNSKNMV